MVLDDRRSEPPSIVHRHLNIESRAARRKNYSDKIASDIARD